jgi:thioredoxin-related protein
MPTRSPSTQILTALLLVWFAAPLLARDGWHETFAAAREAAAKSGNDILLCFTGKEWSGVCRQFDQHFLSDPEFTQKVRAHFEPVQLDVSEFREIDPDEPVSKLPEKAQLKIDFEVNTFPAVFLTRKDGRPYAVTGFRPGGIQSYIQHLDKLRETHGQQEALLLRARQSSGTRAAELIAQSIPDIGELRTAHFYGDLIREVMRLDPTNATGLARNLELKLADHDYVIAMREMDKDLRWSDMLKLTDDYISKYQLSGSERQAALMNRFDILRRQKNFPEMIRTLDEVVRINPYNPHGRQAEQMMRGFAQQIEEESLLESLQKEE